MKTTIKCMKYDPSDEPFLVFEAETAEEMIAKLAEISWIDLPNDIWVKIGSENCLMYDPMLDMFKDWNGIRWVNISNERVIYYFAR